MDTLEILDCGHTPSPHGTMTTGYATLRVHTGAERRICYACAGEADAYAMRLRGVATLYLTRGPDGAYRVTNWPGTLAFPARGVTTREGRTPHGWPFPTRTARFVGPDACEWTITVRGDRDSGTARRLAKRTALDSRHVS